MKSLFRFCIRFLLFALKGVLRLNRGEWFSIFPTTMAETGWMLVLLISLRARTMPLEYMSISVNGAYLLPWSHYVTYNRKAFKFHSAAFALGTSLLLLVLNRFFLISFCPYCCIMLNLLRYPIHTESWQLHTYKLYCLSFATCYPLQRYKIQKRVSFPKKVNFMTYISHFGFAFNVTVCVSQFNNNLLISLRTCFEKDWWYQCRDTRLRFRCILCC